MSPKLGHHTPTVGTPTNSGMVPSINLFSQSASSMLSPPEGPRRLDKVVRIDLDPKTDRPEWIISLLLQSLLTSSNQ